MDPLTFSFTEPVTAERITLAPAPDTSIPDEAWRELARNVAREENLRPSTAGVLSGRWQQGLASVAVRDGQILSYVSLVPILYEDTRPRFSAEIGVDVDRIPDMDMYGSSTGWTHLDWRRKGINSQLRTPLYRRCLGPCCFYIGVTVGLGASPVLVKFGWRIMAWSEIAYASGLAGVAIANSEDQVQSGWRVPPGMDPYEGPHVSPDQDPDHDWSRFCHLWVSNVSMARELNDQWATLMGGDLARWREVVLSVFAARPGSPWTLHLFPDTGSL